MASDASEPVFSSFDEPTEPGSVGSYYLPPDQWDRAVRFVNHLNKLEAKAMLRAKTESYLKAGGQISRKLYPDLRADSPALVEAVVENLYASVLKANDSPPARSDVLEKVSRWAKAISERLNRAVRRHP